MSIYQDRTFIRIFQELLDLGWDLPAKSTIALMGALQAPARSLEQELLVTRYHRDQKSSGPR